MKKFRFFGITLLMIMLTAVFTSCSKSHDDDNSNTSLIVGTWAESPSEEQFVYTFNSNGTGLWEVYNGTTLNNSELFTYKVNGNILEMAAGSATGTMTIKELTDKVLILLSTYESDGKTNTDTFVLYKKKK